MSTEKKEKIENFSVVEETKSYIITEIRSNCGKIFLRALNLDFLRKSN